MLKGEKFKQKESQASIFSLSLFLPWRFIFFSGLRIVGHDPLLPYVLKHKS